MMFQYDRYTQIVRDEARGITIKQDNKFYDMSDFAFLFLSPSVNVRFFAAPRDEDREVYNRDMPTTQRLMVAIEVAERDLARSFEKEVRHGSVDDYGYQDLKRDITEGLRLWGTDGGRLLQYIPDFNVEYVDRHGA